MDANPKADVLRISAEKRAELVRLSRAVVPEEACGLLFGHFGRGEGEVAVAEVVRIANRAAACRAERFELDPTEWVAAEDAARARGLEAVGFWHSHPGGPCTPSDADEALASEGSLQLIVTAAGELRAFRSRGGRLRGLRVQPLP